MLPQTAPARRLLHLHIVRTPVQACLVSQLMSLFQRTPPSFPAHEPTAQLCGCFVSHLFTCPDVPPPPALPSTTPTPRLDHFIAYTLHHTHLHPSVTFAALYILQHLKACFPAAKGSSGHHLFILAFMLASKIICDDTYSNKSWCIVSQGMFALWEINQMEHEMCSYLEWQLNVDLLTLNDFESCVHHNFAGPGPSPLSCCCKLHLLHLHIV
jgi:hypothetical protein